MFSVHVFKPAACFSYCIIDPIPSLKGMENLNIVSREALIISCKVMKFIRNVYHRKQANWSLRFALRNVFKQKMKCQKKKISIYTSHLHLLSRAPVILLASPGTKDSTGQTSRPGSSWPWPGKTDGKRKEGRMDKWRDKHTEREIIQH